MSLSCGSVSKSQLRCSSSIMDVLQMSPVDTVARLECKSQPDSRVLETGSCLCMYDFTVVHGDGEEDKDRAETFFSVLEENYKLKGCHSERDFKVGVFKSQLRRAWQSCSFIIELISKSSLENKGFQKDRSIAHVIESKRTRADHPEILPVYVDIPQKEQRGLSTRVGRSFSNTDPFWDELAAHILNHHSCLQGSIESCSDSNQNDSSSETQEDLTNNNNDDPSEKPPPVKCRKKHKIFRGLFKGKKNKLKRKLKRSSSSQKKSKSSKRKRKNSKKNLKSLRKLLVCVPVKSSECSASSPPVTSQQISAFHTSDTAMVEEVELNVAETAPRMDSSEEHDR